jgi:hypothetical protein
MTDNQDKYILSEESAKAQADLWLANADTDLEESSLFVQLAYNSLIKHIRKGRVEISVTEDGLQVQQNLINPIGKDKEISQITYGEIKVAHRIALDKARGDSEKQYLLLSILSKLGIDTISKIHGADVTISDTLGSLFLLL